VSDLGRARPGTILNSAAATVVALYSFLFLSSLTSLWHPGDYGNFGISFPGDDWRISGVDPGSPAAVAGVRPGDIVTPPKSLSDLLVLQVFADPRPGQVLRIDTTRNGTHHTFTLVAAPIRLAPADVLERALQGVVAISFLIVGLLLVLLRPNKVTWGFYLCAPSICFGLVGPMSLSYIPAGWFVALIYSWDVAAAAALAGLLMFSLRFPNDSPIEWAATIDRWLPAIFVALAAIMVTSDYFGIFHPGSPIGIALGRVGWIAFVAAPALSVAVFAITYSKSNEPERQRIKWVALGLSGILVTLFVAQLNINGLLSNQLTAVGELFGIALPLSVGYAVFRRRVIDVHFVLSRSLVFATIAVILISIAAGIDWVFSRSLPNSRLEEAAYVALALLAGFSLSAARRRIGDAVDALFFRAWHASRGAADEVAASIRRAASVSEVYEPLTRGIARAFSLASAALFEPAQDGGYMRVAAFGWPDGLLWHILEDDSLARIASKARRAANLDGEILQERALPTGVACPTVLVPIVRRNKALAVVFFGSHKIGTVLDPDEIAAIRRLLDDASIVYAASANSRA
jgi:hypothetical protein